VNALTSRIALACYATALALFALAADTVWGALFPAAAARSTELLKDVRPSTVVAAAQAKLEDYAAIKPECFLTPPPPPPPEQPRTEQPQEAQKPAGPAAAYVLKGALCHTNPVHSRAFIEVPGVEEERAYKIGDIVNGATIVAIGDRTVTCARGETKFTLNVNFEDAAGPGQAPPAASENRENKQPNENRQANAQAAAERREEKRAQAPAESAPQPTALESLPPRFRERVQALEPQERERVLRMTPAERMEFFRSRRSQDGGGAKN
jgi:hypothetical protein